MIQPDTKAQVSRMLKALTVAPHSYPQLASISGLTPTVVSRWIARWRKDELVVVGGWLLDSLGRATVAAYKWAPGSKDMPCPAKSNKQRQIEFKARRAKEKTS